MYSTFPNEKMSGKLIKKFGMKKLNLDPEIFQQRLTNHILTSI